METAPPPPAPGWLVRLAGDDFDLRHWRQALQPPHEPWCERIERDAEVIWALLSRGFGGSETAAQVKELALPFIGRLNGAMAVSARTGPVRFDAVGRVDDRGEVHLTVLLETAATMRASAFATLAAGVRDADGNLVPSPPPRPSAAQRWLGLAARDDVVADMLVFAGRADNWFDVYKAIELAERLAKRRHGGKKVKGEGALAALLGPSAKAFETMRQTANYHRHAPNPAIKPKVLTTPEQAESLLSFIVTTVLAREMGGPSASG